MRLIYSPTRSGQPHAESIQMPGSERQANRPEENDILNNLKVSLFLSHCSRSKATRAKLNNSIVSLFNRTIRQLLSQTKECELVYFDRDLKYQSSTDNSVPDGHFSVFIICL